MSVPIENNKDVEIEDLRASLKEKEDQLNNEVIKNATLEQQVGVMKGELNWLREQYDNLCFTAFDKLDDIAHVIKKSNFENLMSQRRKQEEIEQRTQKIKPGENVPPGYMDIKQ